jgi:NAD(P)-dependent dehydrogenase (short-subunit alcohol dehydrogenase family)
MRQTGHRQNRLPVNDYTSYKTNTVGSKPRENLYFRTMKTAIVTGASGNLGQAVIQQFLAAGYHVTGTVVPADPVKLPVTHPDLSLVEADLLNETAAARVSQSVIDKYGHIDAAILTVGGFAMGTVAETTAADLLRQYKLNVETAYNIARPVFLQMMKQGSGRIFMIGARPGIDMKNSKGMVAYGMAKSLIFRMAELMNDEAKGTNVVVVVVVPSTIDTPQNRKAMPDADFSKWVSPANIASVIHFHCSDEAASLRETVIKLYGNS